MNINDATNPHTENDTDGDDDDSTVSTELISLAEFSGQRSSHSGKIVAVRLNYIFFGFIIASACPGIASRLRVIAMQR